MVVEREQVEFDFERGLGRRQHAARVFDDAPQRRARAALERVAVGVGDVAQEPCLDRAVVRRQDREGRKIRAQDHVDFLAADEPVDRATVEGDLPFERAVEFADRDRDVLFDADHVDEAEADVAHVALLGNAKHFPLRHRRHPVNR